jgi:hypothetical protein
MKIAARVHENAAPPTYPTELGQQPFLDAAVGVKQSELAPAHHSKTPWKRGRKIRRSRDRTFTFTFTSTFTKHVWFKLGSRMTFCESTLQHCNVRSCGSLSHARFQGMVRICGVSSVPYTR